jgi:hypothetical protein
MMPEIIGTQIKYYFDKESFLKFQETNAQILQQGWMVRDKTETRINIPFCLFADYCAKQYSLRPK